MKQPLHDQKLARVQAFVSSSGAPQGTAATLRTRDRYGRAHTHHIGAATARTLVAQLLELTKETA